MSENHASVKLYWIICVVLCAITFLEWGIFQIDAIKTQGVVMIPALALMSVVKFILVCGWYMHLRYDHPFLLKYYVAAFLMAAGIVVALGFLLG